jgi:hypothetical protein
MSAYISRKRALFRLLISALPALGVLYLMVYLFSAPRLGPHFDMLMALRHRENALSAAKEILLLETGESGQAENIIEASTAAEIIMTLTEMNARALLIEVPVLGASGGRQTVDSELFSLFAEEFETIDSHIKTLFSGIRLG